MTVCCKCATPLNADEAIYLKNGTHVCPACNDLLDGKVRPPPRPQRIYLSAEKIIAAIVVVAIAIGCYVWNSNRAEERRLAQLEELERAKQVKEAQLREEQLAETRRNDDAIRKAALAGKAPPQRSPADDARVAELLKIELERQKRESSLHEAVEARQAAAVGLTNANEDRLKVQRELILAQAARELDQQWKDALAKKGKLDKNASQDRTGEIAFLLIAISDNQVLRILAEGAKLAPAQRAEWSANIGEALKHKDIVRQRYRVELQGVERPLHLHMQVVDQREEYKRNKEVFESLLIELEYAVDRPKNASRVEEISNDCALKISAAEQRLTELNTTLGERAEAMAVLAVPLLFEQQNLKKLTLKNGTLLWVKSYIVAGDEVLYKDERGLSKTIDKDKIETLP